MKRAQMFHKLGFSVFAIDIYGKGVRPTTTEKKKEMTAYYYENRDLMKDAIVAAVNQAKLMGLSLENSAFVGYCFGGTVGLEIARVTSFFSDFFIFHGGLQTPKDKNFKKNKAKLYLYHGGADSSVTMSDVVNLTTLLEEDKQHYIIQIYSGAPHAFTHFGSDRYRKDADEQSWDHMLNYLSL